MEKRNSYTEFVFVDQHGEEYSLDEIIITRDDLFGYGTIAEIIEHVSGLSCYDFVDEILLYSPLAELAKGYNFAVPNRSDIESILPSEFHLLEIIIFKIDYEYEDEDIYDSVEVERINLFNEIVDWFLDSLSAEAGEQHLGKYWCKQLQNFIDEGRWNLGIQVDGKIVSSHFIEVNDNSTVIMWYGMEGDKPIEEWTFQEEGLPAIIHNYAQYCDINGRDGRFDIENYAIDYERLFQDDLYWFFWELSDEGSDFTKVVKSSPINFDEIYEMSWDQFQYRIKSLIINNNNEFSNVK